MAGPSQALGGLLAAVLVASACGGPPISSPPTSPTSAPVPAGFTGYDGTKLGFAGPDGIAMLVHFEQSVSTDIDTATGAVLFDLTGGSGVVGSRVTAATLAGRRAKRVAGRFSAPGAVAAIDAYVMVVRTLYPTIGLAAGAVLVPHGDGPHPARTRKNQSQP